MPQYMLSVYVGENFSPSAEEMQQIFKDVDALNDEIRAAGAWVFGGGLHPAETATVVAQKGGEIVTTDGPYAESKEHVGGFYVITAADLDEAMAWARKATVACHGAIEVRPFDGVAG